MELIDNFIAVLRKFTVFSGRARRREYWLFMLAGLIISVVLNVLALIPGIGTIFNVLLGIAGLVLLLPSISVGIRRLHDVGRPGKHYLIILVPLIGVILLIMWMAKEGLPEANEYGVNPKAA